MCVWLGFLRVKHASWASVLSPVHALLLLPRVLAHHEVRTISIPFPYHFLTDWPHIDAWARVWSFESSCLRCPDVFFLSALFFVWMCFVCTCVCLVRCWQISTLSFRFLCSIIFVLTTFLWLVLLMLYCCSCLKVQTVSIVCYDIKSKR